DGIPSARQACRHVLMEEAEIGGDLCPGIAVDVELHAETPAAAPFHGAFQNAELFAFHLDRAAVGGVKNAAAEIERQALRRNVGDAAFDDLVEIAHLAKNAGFPALGTACLHAAIGSAGHVYRPSLFPWRFKIQPGD